MDILDMQIAIDDMVADLSENGKSVEEIKELLCDEVERACQEQHDLNRTRKETK